MTEALFDVATPKAKRESPGPVYQGVGKSIRYLSKLHAAEGPDQDADWPTRMAGTIAQAMSLGASIDRASGRDPERRQAAGRDLANLHEQLDALMLRLDPVGVTAEGPSDWDKLQGELANLELEQRQRTMGQVP
jgi:hypothetical protein